MRKTHQLNRMHLRKTDDEPKPKGQILGNYACPACKKEIYIDATRVGFSDTCLHCHANLVTGVLPKPKEQKPTPDAMSFGEWYATILAIMIGLSIILALLEAAP